MYEEAYSTLKLLSSKLRAKILMSLSERAMNLRALRADLGIRGSTILHALSELESLSLVKKVKKNYKLTSIGLMNALILKDILSAAEVIDKQRDFWLQHDLSGIPPNLLKRLGDLRESELLRSEATDLYKVHETFLKLLSESKEVMGISPIFHRDYVNVIRKLVEEGASVEIIVTYDVLDNIMNSIGLSALMSTVKKERLKLFLKNELKLAITVTDRILSLGLFMIDGSYDYNTDLISEDRKAIEWGRELFSHYVEGAKNAAEIF